MKKIMNIRKMITIATMTILIAGCTKETIEPMNYDNAPKDEFVNVEFKNQAYGAYQNGKNIIKIGRFNIESYDNDINLARAELMMRNDTVFTYDISDGVLMINQYKNTITQLNDVRLCLMEWISHSETVSIKGNAATKQIKLNGVTYNRISLDGFNIRVEVK